MTEARGRKRLLALLRLALGLAVLAYVARSLPWRDQLVWTPAEGAPVTLQGTIEGDWKEARVLFRAAWERGEPLELVRGEGLGGGGEVDWKPGMPRAFASLETRGLARGAGLLLVSFLIVVTRWWRLLAVAGCPTSWFDALRLTFIGMFFNLVVPGLTGGDLVKAVVVARENPLRRADALVSVFVDRLLGLATLALLAAVVILLSGPTFTELRLPLLLLLGVGLFSVVLYASPLVRSRVPLGKIADRLPLGDKLRSLDRAALTYVSHPIEMGVAVALSLLNHAIIVLGVYTLGQAVGVDDASVGLGAYFVVVPVANIVSALPLAPGGWGLGEAAYGVLFGMIGANPTLGVALSVVFRLIMLGFGLVGGLFLLLPGTKQAVREAGAEPPEPRGAGPSPRRTP